MKHRNPYSDLGLIIAASVFICIFIKSLLFGITWGGLVWIAISCLYFYVSWKYPSDDEIVKNSTTAYLLLSVVTVVCVVLFDKKAMPKMHAFEGTGDTIQDVRYVDEGPTVVTYEELPVDTLDSDSLSEEGGEIENLDGIDQEGADNLRSDSLTTNN